MTAVITVTCPTNACPNEGAEIIVPDDGFPVLCGGCGAVIANGG